MGKSKLELYQVKYKNEVVHIDSFSAAKMGLIQAQTILKLGDLQIICSPFQISMERAVLLTILSERELPYFTHYTQKLSSLKFSFEKSPMTNQPISLVVWAKINKLIPLKGQQNVCMIDLAYQNCPNELVIILGQYIDAFKMLRNSYSKYKNRSIPINQESVQALKFNNFVEALIGKMKIRIRLGSIAVNQLLMIIPAVSPDLKEGFEFTTKLYFQKYRFALKGKIAKASPPKDGFIKLYFEVDFTPELVDIIDEYFSRNAPPAS